MGKILLVEDDNNLREIYEARLKAEGYETSAAQDGEEALVVAKQSKPDLVISDVMMPKISGFEMLDILRNTPGLEHVKVIMLTALGQAEDRQQADSLGADKYLVKSQVTLEDIVKTAHELLDDELGDAPMVQGSEVTSPTPEAAPAPAAPAPAPEPVDMAVAPAPAEPVPEPAQSDVAAPVAPAEPVPDTTTPKQVESTTMATEDSQAPAEAAPSPSEPEQTSAESAPAASQEDQLSVDGAEQQVADSDASGSAAQEEALVKSQIDEFLASQYGEPAPAAEVAPSESATETTQVDSEPQVEPSSDTQEVVSTPEEPVAAVPEPADSPSQTSPEVFSPTTVPTDDTTSTDAQSYQQTSDGADSNGTDAQVASNNTDDTDNSSHDDQLMAAAADQLSGVAPAGDASPSLGRGGGKVIQPLNSDADQKPDIHELLAREEASTPDAPSSTGQVISSDNAAEQAAPAPAPAVDTPLPTPQASEPVAPAPSTEQPAANPQATAPEQSNDQKPTNGFDPNSVAL